ncbi:MAG: DNA helicase RecQ [Treponema sp.]|nr:DNA helicase RecQ [Treponema sp.]
MNIQANAFEGAKPELVLKTVFGYDSFRPFQKEIITEVLKGKDTLAIMPTGGGKSICYQIPALIMKGITIVVSPLISLMQDQVSSLEASGIHSVFLNSTLDWEAYKQAVNEIKNGKTKIVYISPEGLATTRIRELFTEEDIKISCITIDEAHCISQWGHDFRPDYMEIFTFRRYFPDAVMLALTATATDQVRKDIATNLKLKKPAVFISSFNRDNIYLEVQPKRNALDQVIKCIKKHLGDSGIIYCFSRRQVDELTQTLDKMGYSVLNYHAGLSDEVRKKNQDLFIKDEVQIIVATVAFGMGINKPNVRFVINYDLPKSVEEYYQEIGRAGRDGLPSTALLLYSPGDVNKIRFFFEDAADPQKSEILLQGMLNFASGRECRRTALLRYFGEKYDTKKNDDCCCDICSAGDIPLVDVTIPVQKLMSCIIRTQERFGTNYIVDVLLGSRNKRILENGHNMLSTWGIGNELSKEDWCDLIEMLVFKKLLYKTGDYHVLAISRLGKEVLASREKVLLPIQFTGGRNNGLKFAKAGAKETSFGGTEYKIIKKTEKIFAETPDVNDEEGTRIVTELKQWRKRKADDMNVPPYVIFGDKTMNDIAAKKPKNKQELLSVYGMGNVKVENFGNSILRIVNP